MTQPVEPPSTESLLPLYDIVHFSHGSSVSDLTILCYGKRFHIMVSPKNLQGDLRIASEYESRFQKLVRDEQFGETEESDDFGDPMEGLCFWIASTCNAHMKSLASAQPQVQTLHDWFYPDTLVLTPQVVDGILHVSVSKPDQQLLLQLTPNVELDQSITNLGIPVIPPSKVFLPQDNIKDGLPQRPKKVFTHDGMTHFFKPTYVSESAIREILTLLRLQDLSLSESVRAPRLYALVQYQDPSKISGMLLEYIEHDDDLGYIDVQATALAVREKWIDQIKHTIKTLHTAGIVWGDAKPENLLVDTDENLWIIDFGGGYTQDWVDEGNEGTIEGDNQALSRIVDFLTGEAEKDAT